jgi:hypothetical protein
LPSQLLEEFDPSSPVSVAIERIEHNIVSAHIRHQTYGKDKPKVPENLAELMSKNRTHNTNHKVN